MRNINLLPVAYRPQPKFELRRFVPLLVGGVIVFFLVVYFIFLQLTISNTRNLISTKNNNIRLLEAKSQSEMVVEVVAMDSIITNIEEIESTSIRQVGLLDEIDNFTPRGMDITLLNINSDSISIQGEANELNAISTFINSLNQWDLSENVNLSQITSLEDRHSFSLEVTSWGAEE